MTEIAFIGLGNMGGPMAANLVKAGHRVTGFDLVPALLSTAREAGITVSASPTEAVRDSEVLITMLSAGKHVISVWTEVLPAMAAGTLGYVRARASRFHLCSWSGGGWSGGFQDGQHGHAPAEEAQPAMVGGDVLVVAGARAEEVAQLVVGPTEPGGRSYSPF